MKFIYVVDIYISRIRNKMIKFLNILIKKTPPFIPVTSHSRHNTIQFTSSAAILILSLSLSFLSLKYKVQKNHSSAFEGELKKFSFARFILFYFIKETSAIYLIQFRLCAVLLTFNTTSTLVRARP